MYPLLYGRIEQGDIGSKDTRPEWTAVIRPTGNCDLSYMSAWRVHTGTSGMRGVHSRLWPCFSYELERIRRRAQTALDTVRSWCPTGDPPH